MAGEAENTELSSSVLKPIERRNPDLERIKERLAVVEKQANDTESLAQATNYAVFGIPQDRTNNGLVGTMSDMKRTLTGILVAVVSGVALDIVLRVSNVG